MAAPTEKAWAGYQGVINRLAKKVKQLKTLVDATGMEAKRVNDFLVDFDEKYGFEMGESGEASFLAAVGALEALEEITEYLPTQLIEVSDDLEGATGL